MLGIYSSLTHMDYCKARPLFWATTAWLLQRGRQSQRHWGHVTWESGYCRKKRALLIWGPVGYRVSLHTCPWWECNDLFLRGVVAQDRVSHLWTRLASSSETRLPLPLKCWDLRCAPPYPVQWSFPFRVNFIASMSYLRYIISNKVKILTCVACVLLGCGRR